MRIENFWIILGGEHYKHVTLNNLRILLLAIKGLHVQPDVPLSESNAITLAKGIGKFGPSGDLYLEEQDVEKLIALFSQFNHNRLLFEQKQHLKRKVERENIQEYKFKPSISRKSVDMVEKSRSGAPSG